MIIIIIIIIIFIIVIVIVIVVSSSIVIVTAGQTCSAKCVCGDARAKYMCLSFIILGVIIVHHYQLWPECSNATFFASSFICDAVF